MEPATTTIAIVKGAMWLGSIIFAAHKASKAYNKHSKRQKEKLALKGKSIDEARKDKEQAQKETDELKKKYDENEQQIKELQRKTEETRNRANDTNLSEEERIM
jgi:uncharacterized protein HemX